MIQKILIFLLIIFFAQWWFSSKTISVPTNNLSFNYIVKYSGKANRNDELPMLIALHGNGDSMSNFYDTALDKFSVPVRIILIKAPIGSSWPWSAADFKHYGKAINEAIILLSEEYPTLGKPLLLGFSGGGMMAYYQALKHGDTYSYIFPISGQFSNALLMNNVFKPGASVFAYHGTKDRVLSISGGIAAVNLLRNHAIDVNFTSFDGGHHGIFTNMKYEITKDVEQKIEFLKQ